MEFPEEVFKIIKDYAAITNTPLTCKKISRAIEKEYNKIETFHNPTDIDVFRGWYTPGPRIWLFLKMSEERNDKTSGGMTHYWDSRYTYKVIGSDTSFPFGGNILTKDQRLTEWRMIHSKNEIRLILNQAVDYPHWWPALVPNDDGFYI